VRCARCGGFGAQGAAVVAAAPAVDAARLLLLLLLLRLLCSVFVWLENPREAHAQRPALCEGMCVWLVRLEGRAFAAAAASLRCVSWIVRVICVCLAIGPSEDLMVSFALLYWVCEAAAWSKMAQRPWPTLTQSTHTPLYVSSTLQIIT